MKCQGEEILMKNKFVLVKYFDHDIHTIKNDMKNVMKITKQNESTFMFSRTSAHDCYVYDFEILLHST